MKVALYARVSSEKQAEKDLSIPAQLRALREYTIKKGLDIYTEYVDEAQSARSADRPKFQEMIATAKHKTHPFNIILVWKLSRFARNREDSIIYKALLHKHGVNVVSINEQIDDTPSGKLLEGIIETIDEFYSSNLSHDTIRGMKENAQRGFLNGGTPSYGYMAIKLKVGPNEKTKMDIDKADAPVVKRMFKMCLQGMGAKEITKKLNEEGLKTRKGREWETNAIQYILRNETYTGVRIFNRVHKNSVHPIQHSPGEEIRIENAHPIIIDKSTFRRAQELIKQRSPKRIHPRTINSPYLLSGFLYCGQCGASMPGCAAKSSQFFYYGCHNHIRRGPAACSSKLVNKERLEQAVIEKLKSRVLTEANLTKLVQMVNEEVTDVKGEAEEITKGAEAQIKKLNDKLQNLYSVLETGKLNLDDLAPRIKTLRSQIEELEKSKFEAETNKTKEEVKISDSEVKPYVEDLMELLEKGSIFERKSFLRSFIKRIDLNRPQGGTIEYTLPLVPTNGKSLSNLEVLSMGKSGVADGI